MDHPQALGMTSHSQSDQTHGIDARKKDIEGQFPKDGGGDHSVNERKTPKTILDPQGKFLQSWNVIFLLSCVISVLLDPLFFYLPVINEDKKCIGLDKKLWITAIVLRSVTDIIYLMHIILQFRTGFIDKERGRLGKGLNTDAWKIAKRYLWPYFLIDILAILPIPQVVISSIFSEMRRTKSSHKMIPLNSAILFQYVPRVLLIYLSWMELIRSNEKFGRTIWFKAALNFFLYLLAGHVFGAFWYFFSTQRVTFCWRKACLHQGGCIQGSFNCDHRFGNLSALHDFCSIDSTNTSTFDFGIFLEARQSRILESMDFPKKLIYSAWWGLRNLSSFGSNLQTSSYIWENIFALGISIFGLLLFLYFIGNLQMYMQWATKEREEDLKGRMRKRRKRQQNLDLWMSKYDFDSTTRGDIIDYMAKNYEADEDVYVETLIPDLPPELRSAVYRHICLNLLKSLEIIKDCGLAKHESLLLKICDSLKPMFYNEHCYIVREGDPIDAVFFITAGTVWTYTSNNGEGSDSQHTEHLKDQYFGGELLELVLTSTSYDISNLSKVPVSSKTLKTYTKVEAFALMAHDLKRIWQSNRINPSALICLD